MLAVVAARPNFVKAAPVISALEGTEGISVRVLHTGQHYDRALSGGFIERLGMREPDANLEVGSGTHAEQTAGVLIGIERDLLDHPADMVLVPGDVNSTMGAALAATKLGVAVAHIEAGPPLTRLVDARGGEPRRHGPRRRSPALHLRGRVSRTSPRRASAVRGCSWSATR